KMIWQFGELGYDIDINQNGRTGAKPILWSYLQDTNRRRLRDTYANLIALRKLPGYSTATFTSQLGSQSKSMHLTSTDLKMTVVGNFGLFSDQIDPDFQQTGKWYNYLTGDSITVANPHTLLDLNVGEFAVYTSTRIRRLTLATRAEQANVLHLAAAPNPASGSTTLLYKLPAASAVQLTVRNVLGQAVLTLPDQRETTGPHTRELALGKLAAGVYIVQLRADTQQQTLRLVVE
ncbi:MAG: T9SS type A sorting domain-containing protein, partial [Bacteroidota bacterium]|nr:T9SS type A sorting domain-containing protein [Bacteroidota bacterium]